MDRTEIERLFVKYLAVIFACESHTYLNDAERVGIEFTAEEETTLYELAQEADSLLRDLKDKTK